MLLRLSLSLVCFTVHLLLSLSTKLVLPPSRSTRPDCCCCSFCILLPCTAIVVLTTFVLPLALDGLLSLKWVVSWTYFRPSFPYSSPLLLVGSRCQLAVSIPLAMYFACTADDGLAIICGKLPSKNELLSVTILVVISRSSTITNRSVESSCIQEKPTFYRAVDLLGLDSSLSKYFPMAVETLYGESCDSRLVSQAQIGRKRSSKKCGHPWEELLRPEPYQRRRNRDIVQMSPYGHRHG